MPHLIPAQTTCTGNSHPVLKETLTHVLIPYPPLDPCRDNSYPVLKETLTHVLIHYPPLDPCRDNSHPVLKETLTHVLIHYPPLDPCRDNSYPVLKETLTHVLIQQFSLPLVDHFYTALFSDLEQTHCALDACHSKCVTCFLQHFLNSGVKWNCRHFGACSVYTIQPCTTSLHAKPHT